MRIFNAIIAGLAGVAMLYGAAAAAMTGYLKIPDIDGESASRYDGGQFEIESFSWEYSMGYFSAVAPGTRTLARGIFSTPSYPEKTGTPCVLDRKSVV